LQLAGPAIEGEQGDGGEGVGGVDGYGDEDEEPKVAVREAGEAI